MSDKNKIIYPLRTELVDTIYRYTDKHDAGDIILTVTELLGVILAGHKYAEGTDYGLAVREHLNWVEDTAPEWAPKASIK